MREARIRSWVNQLTLGQTDNPKRATKKGELLKPMRERDREINRRRHRYHKRKKLRLKLGAAGAEAEQQKIEARIRKTYPSHTPAS